MDRAFKGVWIPKGIWENKDMSWMEKLFITEIESLDKENGCFASNPYFAEFFNLKITRTSQIINSLIKKGFITARYERKGKQIVKRVLTINCRNLFTLLYEPIKKSVRTPLEKCRDNNTINNTINTENALDIDLGIEPEKAQRQQRFTVPTEQEVKAYLKERGITTFQAAQFIDYYESKGWMIGKNRMKNWKAAVRTWERNDINKSKDAGPKSTGALAEWERDRDEALKGPQVTVSDVRALREKLGIR